MKIQDATLADAPILTKIAFSAKRHWNYPESYFTIWANELTISENYIQRNTVYKYSDEDKVIGFYSLVYNPDNFFAGKVFVEQGYWLEHIFILPQYHKRGIGRKLINHLLDIAKTKNIKEILIFVDPYAKGFYEKTGAIFAYNSKSSIPGRTIPVYKLKV